MPPSVQSQAVLAWQALWLLPPETQRTSLYLPPSACTSPFPPSLSRSLHAPFISSSPLHFFPLQLCFKCSVLHLLSPHVSLPLSALSLPLLSLSVWFDLDAVAAVSSKMQIGETLKEKKQRDGRWQTSRYGSCRVHRLTASQQRTKNYISYS